MQGFPGRSGLRTAYAVVLTTCSFSITFTVMTTLAVGLQTGALRLFEVTQDFMADHDQFLHEE